MPATETPDKEIRRLVIEKHLDYQLALVNRRWQYFATYLLLNGLLFNVWKDIGTGDKTLVTLLSSGSIVVTIIFLQLVSLASVRIEKSQQYLLKNKANVFDSPLDGRIRLKSETNLLYFAFSATSIGWFYLLLIANYTIGIVTVLIFVVNLFTLRWKATKSS